MPEVPKIGLPIQAKVSPAIGSAGTSSGSQNNIETQPGQTPCPFSETTSLNPAAQVAFTAQQSLKANGNTTHKNRLPIQSFTLPTERFGGNNVNLAKTILTIAERIIPEYAPILSFTGSMTFAIHEDTKSIDYDNVHDLDTVLYLNRDLPEKQRANLIREILNELQNQGIIIDMPAQEDAFCSVWGIREKTGKKYDFQIPISKTENLSGEPGLGSYGILDAFYGKEDRISLLNDKLREAGFEKSIDRFVNHYRNILQDVEDSLNKKDKNLKLKALKRLFQLASMRGKEKEYNFLLDAHKELAKNYNETTLQEIANTALSELRSTDTLREDLILVFQSRSEEPNMTIESNPTASNTQTKPQEKPKAIFPQIDLEKYEARKERLHNDPEVFNEYMELQELAKRILEYDSYTSLQKALGEGETWVETICKTCEGKIHPSEKMTREDRDELNTLTNGNYVSSIANDFAEVYSERGPAMNIFVQTKLDELSNFTKEEILAHCFTRFHFPEGFNTKQFYENAKQWASTNKPK